jgi:hypothetical protein
MIRVRAVQAMQSNYADSRQLPDPAGWPLVSDDGPVGVVRPWHRAVCHRRLSASSTSDPDSFGSSSPREKTTRYPSDASATTYVARFVSEFLTEGYTRPVEDFRRPHASECNRPMTVGVGRSHIGVRQVVDRSECQVYSCPTSPFTTRASEPTASAALNRIREAAARILMRRFCHQRRMMASRLRKRHRRWVAASPGSRRRTDLSSRSRSYSRSSPGTSRP